MPDKIQDMLQDLKSSPTLLARREFLKRAAAVGLGSLLTACGIRDNETRHLPPAEVMASPQPRGLGEATQTPAAQTEGGLSLENFLALSAVLTGFEVGMLSRDVGQVYLNSLQTSDTLKMTPAQLYQEAGFGSGGPAPPLQALEEAGIFDQEPARQLADKIIKYWYTGLYDKSADEQAVATYVDALTFKAMAYGPALTICGPEPNFWEQLPEAAPMPPVHTAGLKQDDSSGGN